MAELTNQFVEEFRETIETATRQLQQISAEDSSVPLADGKWSRKQIIGHLIDSAANNHARFVRAQLDDQFVFSGYRQEEWVALQKYNEEPWDQLVALWRYYNLHLAHIIGAVSEQRRNQVRRSHNIQEIGFKAVGKDKPVTLDFLMRDYVDHLRHHLSQILGPKRN